MASQSKEPRVVSKPCPSSQDWPEDEHLYENGFIDRIRVIVRCPHDEPVGKYVHTGADLATGQLIWRDYSHVEVGGPHGAAQVRTHDPGYNQELDITFCPGKYLHGHNAFCPGDLGALLIEGVTDIIERLGLKLPNEELERLRSGQVELHEVHCTAMLDLRSDSAVRNALGDAARGKHAKLRQVHTYPSSGPPQTVTYGSGRTYRVTLYNKANEMAARREGTDGTGSEAYEQASEWAKGKLRVEVCFKRNRLKQLNLEQASEWTQSTPGRLVREQLRLIRVNETSDLPPVVEESLSPGERRAYQLWKNGGDLKRFYKSSRSIKKYRNRFLQLGIDIGIPYHPEFPLQKEYAEVVAFSTIQELPFDGISTE